jgi:heat shock protein HtpX
VDRAVFKTERGVGHGYMITVIVLPDRVPASRAVSSWGVVFAPARIPRGCGLGHLPQQFAPMINALKRLGGLQPGALRNRSSPPGYGAAADSARSSRATPPIEDRIAALEGGRR